MNTSYKKKGLLEHYFKKKIIFDSCCYRSTVDVYSNTKDISMTKEYNNLLTNKKLLCIVDVQKLYINSGGVVMLTVNYTNLRENMKSYMDKVTDDYETIIVTRKDNKNIVMLSEETYNNLMENIYVMGNKNNYDWLMESKAQLETGKKSIHSLIEVDANE